jgi:hypothetical protein
MRDHSPSTGGFPVQFRFRETRGQIPHGVSKTASHAGATTGQSRSAANQLPGPDAFADSSAAASYHLESQPNMRLQRMSAHDSAIGSAANDLEMQSRTLFGNGNIAEEREDLDLFIDDNFLCCFRLPVEIPEESVAERPNRGNGSAPTSFSRTNLPSSLATSSSVSRTTA